MNTPEVMIGEDVLEDAEVDGGSTTAPGARVRGYVGTKRVEIWLSDDTAREVAALYENEEKAEKQPQWFKYPWER